MLLISKRNLDTYRTTPEKVHVNVELDAGGATVVADVVIVSVNVPLTETSTVTPIVVA